jgi:hypothetical protein
MHILPESGVLPTHALLLPKAGGYLIAPQPTASGDHNVPQHQKLIFEVVKVLKKAIGFRNTFLSIVSDEKYLMVDEDWQLAIEQQDCRRDFTTAPIGTPCVYQLSGGPSLKIDLQT